MTQPQILLLAGALLFLIGFFWAMILAFRTTVWWGLAFLFVPFGWLIFLIGHLRDNSKPALLVFCGGLLFWTGFLRIPQPGQLTASQAKADRLCAELTQKRSTINPDDKAAAKAFNDEVIAYNALLQKNKDLTAELETAFYATSAPAKSARRTPAENAALSYADEDLLELEAESVNVRNRLSKKTDPLLAAHNFTELDRIAAELRSSKVQCANGVWHLRSFYDGFAMLPDYLPESAWTDRIAIFQAWIKERPSSITARVGLASVWCEWAWRARGGNYAPRVPAKGWQLFRDRLTEAAKVLADARNLNDKCAGWWDVAQRVALGEGWDRTKYDQLFEDAVRFDRLYTGFYTNKNNYLLPRWFGKPGECAAFAEAAANRLGGEEGDILYARLVWRLHSMDVFPNGSIVQQAGASWPRVRKGLESILNRQPRSIAAASELCYLCGQQGERDRMKQLFMQMGPFVDTTVYGDNRRFLQDRRVAFQE